MSQKITRKRRAPRDQFSDHQNNGRRFIDRRGLLARIPLSYPTIWKRMRHGTFPRPHVLGGKNAWDLAEVEAFLGSLPRRQYPERGDE
jgi:predicted DNA-binding transcriptional regulator AlpA